MDSQGTATRQKLNRKKEESKDSSFFMRGRLPRQRMVQQSLYLPKLEGKKEP